MLGQLNMAGDKIKMDVKLPNQELLNADHFTRMILRNINDFRKTMKYCDITLIVDGVEFVAHRIMLAGFSPYFETFFSGLFPESKESSIVMSSIDSYTMGLILDYAYTGNIEITESNAQAVLHAASFLQVRMLFDECCHFLENNISASNCLGIFNIAKVYSCSSLEEKSWEYTLRNFLEVSLEQEFLELDADLLVDLIGNDTLRINAFEWEDERDFEVTEKLVEKCEENVFEAVVRWLEYKENERTSALPEVLARVRLAFLSPWFLFDRVETVNAIRTTPACSSLVAQAVYFSVLGNRKTELQSSISRRRNYGFHFQVLLMYGVNLEVKGIVCVTEDGSFVKDFTPPPVDFEFYVVSNYQNQCVGIHGERMWYQYTHGGCNWEPIVPMGKSRRGFGVSELDGLWFVFGGVTDSGVCDDVDEYDNWRSWRSVSSLPVAVSQPMTVVTMRGRIYVIGGLDKNNRAISIVQCYDPRHDTWTQLPTLPAIGEFKACVIGNNIYVCQYFSTVSPDDEGACRQVFVYSAFKNEWVPGPELRHHFVSGPVSFNGNMIVLTKKDEGSHILERYSPSSNSWKELAVFPSKQSQYIAGPVVIYRP